MCLQTFEGHSGTVTSVDFSPDGNTILSGSADNTLKLWSLEGVCLQTFEGHSGTVTSVDFSPDGNTILSGSADNTLKLWSLEGVCLQTFEGHSGTVTSVDFSPDGNTILSGSGDGSMRVWSQKSSREAMRLYSRGEEWYSFDLASERAKGTPLSWRLPTLYDAEGEPFTIDRLAGFEPYGYEQGV